MEEKIAARVYRYDPRSGEPPRYQEYEVPYQQGMTVLRLVRHIYRYQDPTLAFRDFHCGRGVCRTCQMKVNGKVVRSCCTPLKPGQELVIEPSEATRVIRDLVIAM